MDRCDKEATNGRLLHAGRPPARAAAVLKSSTSCNLERTLPPASPTIPRPRLTAGKLPLGCCQELQRTSFCCCTPCGHGLPFQQSSASSTQWPSPSCAWSCATRRSGRRA
jgi:hypothetical protein